MTPIETQRIINNINNSPSPGILAFWAEQLCEGTKELAIPVLLNLLNYPSPIVVAGAIYGCYGHITNKSIFCKLKNISTNDSSPIIQRMALDALDWYAIKKL
jgi:hypothetical protein